MLLIGSHVSFRDKQLLGCVEDTISYGANSFMFYTGAPANSIRRSINPELTQQAHDLMIQNNINIANVFCHAPYIINLANTLKPEQWDFSIQFIKQEIKRCQLLGISQLIFHPGSHVNLSKEEGIKNIINALNIIFEDNDQIKIILEYMSGKGSEVGSNLAELKMIIDGIKKPELIGICLDTCHLNDSGVDLKNFDSFLNEFDTIIGLDKLKCIHLNDSKNEVGQKKDRHANIGFGTIGFTPLLNIIYHDKLKNIPKILETPWVNDNPPYKQEITMINDKVFDPNLLNKL